MLLIRVTPLVLCWTLLTCEKQRDKAWAVFPYPCIGRWRFLNIYLASTPYYPEILQTLRGESGVFIDVGCCFGQVLRQLVVDGVPPFKLVGVDLRPEFFELGYELFRDQDRPPAKFVAADLLNGEGGDELNGTASIVHAASVFHLFGWEDQVKLGVRVTKLFRPEGEAVVFGRQVGNYEPKELEEHASLGLKRYFHNPETWQKLWDEVGNLTGSKWKVDATMIDWVLGTKVNRPGIRFAVRRQ